MNTLEKLVKALSYQSQRRIGAQMASKWGSKQTSVRLDPLYVYQLDRLAAKFGLTRGGMARELLECVIGDAYFDVFAEEVGGPDGPARSCKLPTEEEIDRHMQRVFGEASEVSQEEAA
jgi:predicted DNA-binding protein